MKKKIFGLIILGLMVVGCSSNKTRSAIKIEDFNTKMIEAGFAVSDNMDLYKNDKTIIAANKAVLDDITIEMVVYDKDDSANLVQKHHIEQFHTLKSVSANEEKDKGKNYYRYVYIANSYYMISSRIDETLIFSKTSLNNLDKMKNIFDKMGY